MLYVLLCDRLFVSDKSLLCNKHKAQCTVSVHAILPCCAHTRVTEEKMATWREELKNTSLWVCVALGSHLRQGGYGCGAPCPPGLGASQGPSSRQLASRRQIALFFLFPCL